MKDLMKDFWKGFCKAGLVGGAGGVGMQLAHALTSIKWISIVSSIGLAMLTSVVFDWLFGKPNQE